LIGEELKTFSFKKWLRAYFAKGLIEFLEKGKRILPDYSGFKSVFIDPFGNIYPSGVWGLKIGQLSKIKNWPEFSRRIKEMDLIDRGPANWMVGTVRQSMRKHWFKVLYWIFANKFNLCSLSFSRKIYRDFSAFCETKKSFSKILTHKIIRSWRSLRMIFGIK
jgi:hypothetical protein